MYIVYFSSSSLLEPLIKTQQSFLWTMASEKPSPESILDSSIYPLQKSKDLFKMQIKLCQLSA